MPYTPALQIQYRGVCGTESLQPNQTIRDVGPEWDLSMEAVMEDSARRQIPPLPLPQYPQKEKDLQVASSGTRTNPYSTLPRGLRKSPQLLSARCICCVMGGYQELLQAYHVFRRQVRSTPSCGGSNQHSRQCDGQSSSQTPRCYTDLPHRLILQQCHHCYQRTMVTSSRVNARGRKRKGEAVK
jgi:hypothetical protein